MIILLAAATLSHCVLTGDSAKLGGSCGKIFDQTTTLHLAPASKVEGGVWSKDETPSAIYAGELTVEGDASASIQLEIYSGNSGILRTEYGWFPVTNFSASASSLAFDVNPDVEVPPNALDREIVKRSAEILSSAGVWNRADTRDCAPTASTWSIYCAMEKATAEVTGATDHRRPALEVVRDLVDERTKGRNYHHRLMDYNNDPTTTLADVQSLFAEALRRIDKAIGP